MRETRLVGENSAVCPGQCSWLILNQETQRLVTNDRPDTWPKDNPPDYHFANNTGLFTVIGASDDRAERPTDQPHGPEDLFATMSHLMGIDPEQEFLTPEGRPIKIVNDGKVIRSIL